MRSHVKCERWTKSVRMQTTKKKQDPFETFEHEISLYIFISSRSGWFIVAIFASLLFFSLPRFKFSFWDVPYVTFSSSVWFCDLTSEKIHHLFTINVVKEFYRFFAIRFTILSSLLSLSPEFMDSCLLCYFHCHPKFSKRHISVSSARKSKIARYICNATQLFWSVCVVWDGNALLVNSVSIIC